MCLRPRVVYTVCSHAVMLAQEDCEKVQLVNAGKQLGGFFVPSFARTTCGPTWIQPLCEPRVDIRLGYGFCPTCTKEYSVHGKLTETTILNYWAYKNNQNMSQPVDAVVVPLGALFGKSSVVHDDPRDMRLETITLSEALHMWDEPEVFKMSQAYQYGIGPPNLIAYLEDVRWATLHKARHAKPARPASIHIDLAPVLAPPMFYSNPSQRSGFSTDKPLGETRIDELTSNYGPSIQLPAMTHQPKRRPARHLMTAGNLPDRSPLDAIVSATKDDFEEVDLATRPPSPKGKEKAVDAPAQGKSSCSVTVESVDPYYELRSPSVQQVIKNIIASTSQHPEPDNSGEARARQIEVLRNQLTSVFNRSHNANGSLTASSYANEGHSDAQSSYHGSDPSGLRGDGTILRRGAVARRGRVVTEPTSERRSVAGVVETVSEYDADSSEIEGGRRAEFDDGAYADRSSSLVSRWPKRRSAAATSSPVYDPFSDFSGIHWDDEPTSVTVPDDNKPVSPLSMRPVSSYKSASTGQVSTPPGYREYDRYYDDLFSPQPYRPLPDLPVPLGLTFKSPASAAGVTGEDDDVSLLSLSTVSSFSSFRPARLGQISTAGAVYHDYDPNRDELFLSQPNRRLPADLPVPQRLAFQTVQDEGDFIPGIDDSDEDIYEASPVQKSYEYKFVSEGDGGSGPSADPLPVLPPLRYEGNHGYSVRSPSPEVSYKPSQLPPRMPLPQSAPTAVRRKPLPQTATIAVRRNEGFTAALSDNASELAAMHSPPLTASRIRQASAGYYSFAADAELAHPRPRAPALVGVPALARVSAGELDSMHVAATGLRDRHVMHKVPSIDAVLGAGKRRSALGLVMPRARGGGPERTLPPKSAPPFPERVRGGFEEAVAHPSCFCVELGKPACGCPRVVAPVVWM